MADPDRADGRIAVAGATGYIGGLLVERLAGEGAEVAALARSPQRAERLAGDRVEVRRADVGEPASLPAALEGAVTAYYLVHSMGRGSGGGFAERDRRGAENFARAASEAGVSRIVYLGGLGEGSEHLDSRHETAQALAGGDVPVAYFRAAAVIGPGSESFRTVVYLVRRLPLMVTPRWVHNRTQPIAVDDVVAYLVAAGALGSEVEREIEIGGPDVTTYAGMMDEAARAMDKRPRPRVSVPLLTPALSSLWLGLITPVDTGVARPLVEGLSHDTVVTDPSGMALFDLEPMPLAEAMRRALAEDPDS
ncbi:MAG TPA: NAD(P)H-binding protein [Solirubrobacterales bacterium]|nr:NAD(P)H-binding protein [Solirubrobacterales bacterium]